MLGSGTAASQLRDHKGKSLAPKGLSWQARVTRLGNIQCIFNQDIFNLQWVDEDKKKLKLKENLYCIQVFHK